MKKSNKYKLIIFDFDGTILNTIEDLADAVNHALTHFNMPNRSLAEVTAFVGNGMKTLISRSVPENTDENTIEEVLAEFMAYYKLHSADKTRAYEGIYNILDQLKQEGYLLAVASNKADSAIQDLCKKYFDGYFHYQAGEKAGIPKKPQPDILFHICSQLGVSLDESLLIGDSEVDIQTAINADMTCISAEWGFRSKEVLIEAGAQIFASKPADILDILSELNL